MSRRSSLTLKCFFVAAIDGIICIIGSPHSPSDEIFQTGRMLHPPLKAFTLICCPLILPLVCSKICNHGVLLLITLFVGAKMGTLGPENAECLILVLLDCQWECSYCEILALPSCKFFSACFYPLCHYSLHILQKTKKHHEIQAVNEIIKWDQAGLCSLISMMPGGYSNNYIFLNGIYFLADGTHLFQYNLKSLRGIVYFLLRESARRAKLSP